MRFILLTLFPEFFTSAFQTALLGKAVTKGHLEIHYVNIRDYAINDHGQVDDTPYGGGAGMIMRPEPLAAAITHAKTIAPNAPVIYFTPAGDVLTQTRVENFSTSSTEYILLCGRYEGIDQRIIDTYVDIELSLGNFILQGGEIAALTFIEAVSRFVPGVIGNAESVLQDSFSPALDGKKEHPLYTKPEIFAGMSVPDVLLSGNHAEIAKWRERHLR